MPAPEQEVYHPRGGRAAGLCPFGGQQPVHPAAGLAGHAPERQRRRADRLAAAGPCGRLGGPLAARRPGLGPDGLDLSSLGRACCAVSATPSATPSGGAAGCWPAGAGLFLRVERRFRLDRLTCAEVRLSPAARLLRCYPVYLTAGSCSADDPLFVYRAGQEALVRRLLPGFEMPPRRRLTFAQVRGAQPGLSGPRAGGAWPFSCCCCWWPPGPCRRPCLCWPCRRRSAPSGWPLRPRACSGKGPGRWAGG